LLIHRVTRDDRALLDTAVRTFRKVVVEDHTPFLSDPATVASVALSDTVVVGWVWGHRQRHICGYTQFQLYEIEIEIEVVESARRRGVGRALMAEFMTVARAEGAAKVWLFTDEDNHAAKALYMGLGWRTVPARRRDVLVAAWLITGSSPQCLGRIRQVHLGVQ
jgi:ribosomal protein S18 acetylase RimI-like enzyme